MYATGDILSTSDGFSQTYIFYKFISHSKFFVRGKIVDFHIFSYQKMIKIIHIKMCIKNKGHSLKCNELPHDQKNVFLSPAHCITPPVLDARVVSAIHREYSHWRQLTLCYSAKREHEKKNRWACVPHSSANYCLVSKHWKVLFSNFKPNWCIFHSTRSDKVLEQSEEKHMENQQTYSRIHEQTHCNTKGVHLHWLAAFNNTFEWMCSMLVEM